MSRRSCILVIALAGGCGRSTQSPPQISVTDSAGISVVSLDVLPWQSAPPLTISERPTVEIGVESGDSAYELYGVMGAARFQSGEIVIANAGTGEVRIYDAEGRFVRAIGRSGKGPDEFAGLAGIETVQPDTIVALDAAKQSIEGYALGGQHLWSRSLEILPNHWLIEQGPISTRLEDGDFIVVAEEDNVWAGIRAGTMMPGTTQRAEALVLHVPFEGGPADTIAVSAATELAVIDNEGRAGTMSPAWAHALAYAIGSESVTLGTQERFEINQFSASGSLQAVIRGPDEDLRIMPEDLENLARAIIEQAGDNRAQAERFAEDYTKQYPRPEMRPAYGRIMMDSDDRIWISEPYHALEFPRRWGVIDVESATVSSLEVPAGFEPLEIGTGYILGRWRDANGVEFVRLYTLSGVSRGR